MRHLGVYAVVERIANFPFWGAIWGAGLARVEKGSPLNKQGRHNVGLCRVGRVGVGGEVGFISLCLGVAWRVVGKFSVGVEKRGCKFRKVAEGEGELV